MMSTTDTTTSDAAPRSEEAELRRRAAKRACICPGAGFALIGHGPYAIVTYIASFCILPAVAWLAFEPTSISLSTAIAVLVIAMTLWVAELIAIKKVAPRTSSPFMLDRGFIAATAAVWLAATLAIGLVVTAFGSQRIAGSGMEPIFEEGERVIYHKHVDQQSLKPGAIIVYKNANDSGWGQPGWIVISRVLAAPGDKLSMQDGRYNVNGATGPPIADIGEHNEVLDIPTSPESLKIPNDCYFVVQDSGGFDSRVLSWVRADDIVGVSLW